MKSYFNQFFRKVFKKQPQKKNNLSIFRAFCQKYKESATISEKKMIFGTDDLLAAGDCGVAVRAHDRPLPVRHHGLLLIQEVRVLLLIL